METQTTTTTTNWLKDELEKQNTYSAKDYERRPALKVEENKMVDIEVDFSKPWDKWENKENGSIKKIIPVTNMSDNNKYYFWLNVANPLYRELLTFGLNGVTRFRVLRTGQAKATKYILVN